MGERNDSLWENLKRGLQGSAAVAVTKAEELTQQGRARLDIAAAKTRLSRLHSELGAAVYSQLESSSDDTYKKTLELQSLCEQIGRASEEVAEAEEAFSHLKEARDQEE